MIYVKRYVKSLERRYIIFIIIKLDPVSLSLCGTPPFTYLRLNDPLKN